MTSNWLEAKHNQRQKSRLAEEQERERNKTIASTVGSILATIATIALML